MKQPRRRRRCKRAPAAQRHTRGRPGICGPARLSLKSVVGGRGALQRTKYTGSRAHRQASSRPEKAVKERVYHGLRCE